MSTAKDIAKLHIFMCIEAAKCESNGDIKTADRLRAQGYLRLIVMNDDELAYLAHYLANPPIYSEESVIIELLSRIDELIHTAGSWIPDLTRDSADFISTN